MKYNAKEISINLDNLKKIQEIRNNRERYYFINTSESNTLYNLEEKIYKELSGLSIKQVNKR